MFSIDIQENVDRHLEDMGGKLAESWNEGDMVRYNDLMRRLYRSTISEKGLKIVLKHFKNKTI